MSKSGAELIAAEIDRSVDLGPLHPPKQCGCCGSRHPRGPSAACAARHEAQDCLCYNEILPHSSEAMLKEVLDKLPLDNDCVEGIIKGVRCLYGKENTQGEVMVALSKVYQTMKDTVDLPAEVWWEIYDNIEELYA